ncbi:MAG: TetR/AcrR family transcriptional regulator [Pseudomonadota bacterium]
MATQEQRSKTTKAKLLAAFRASFLERGFEATTMQQTLADTGLSKGAMYHHFRGKAEVIEALYEEESRGAIERAMASAGEAGSPLVRLRDMCLAWTKEVRDRDVAKILFSVGPSALGVDKAREIENGLGLKYIEELLQEAVDAGDIALADPRLTASFINALVGEAAIHYIRTKNDPREALGQTLDAVLGLVSPTRAAS